MAWFSKPSPDREVAKFPDLVFSLQERAAVRLTVGIQMTRVSHDLRLYDTLPLASEGNVAHLIW